MSTMLENRKLLTLLVAFLMLSMGCKDSPSAKVASVTPPMPDSDHPSYVTAIESAHGKAELFENQVICFNLDMTFGSTKSLMKIMTTPNSSSVRVDKSDGTSTIVLNGDVYTNADSTNWARERSSLFTYQYFFMLPYKLSDEGTKWERLPEMKIKEQMMDRAKLTFERGTGDAPDDWYIVHSDKVTHMINAVGYIVTGGGTSIEEAEEHAHAIEYLDYRKFDKVPIATTWNFYRYNKEVGLGSQIGQGIIRNVETMDNIDQFSIALTDDYVKIN